MLKVIMFSHLQDDIPAVRIAVFVALVPGRVVQVTVC